MRYIPPYTIFFLYHLHLNHTAYESEFYIIELEKIAKHGIYPLKVH